MPKITLDKKYLMGLVGKVSEKKLAEQLNKLGMEVEELGTESIILEVSANRPDLLGAVGVARAVKNYMHRSERFRYDKEMEESGISVSVGRKVGKVYPFISAIIARGDSIGNDALKDIIDFTEKLTATYGRERRRLAIGLHDLKAVKPPLYYDAYKDSEFVPLNEKKDMKYSEILEKLDIGIAYSSIVENGRNGYPALRDSEGTMALIPVINSERTKVSPETSGIFVDMTGTSKYLVEKAAGLIAAMFMDLEWKVEKVGIVYGERIEAFPKMEKRELYMPLLDIEEELGVKLGFNNALSLANKMGYDAAYIEGRVRFIVPQYRLDIIDWQDVMEDMAIAYGYDYIAPLVVPAVGMGKIEERSVRFEKLSGIMVGMGFSESMNSYLTNESYNFDNMLVKKRTDYVKLKDPKASSLTMMRTWLLPSLLRCIGLSVHEKMPQRLFELDMAFHVESEKPVEEYHIAAIEADSKANFNKIKAVVESIAYMLGLKFEIKKLEHESFIPGRCAGIYMNGANIGFFGELHPQVMSNFGVEEPSVAAEIVLGS